MIVFYVFTSAQLSLNGDMIWLKFWSRLVVSIHSLCYSNDVHISSLTIFCTNWGFNANNIKYLKNFGWNILNQLLKLMTGYVFQVHKTWRSSTSRLIINAYNWYVKREPNIFMCWIHCEGSLIVIPNEWQPRFINICNVLVALQCILIISKQFSYFMAHPRRYIYWPNSVVNCIQHIIHKGCQDST